MSDSSRVRALDDELFRLSERWHHDIGKDCWLARRFRRMINPDDSDYRGGVWTVRHLLYTPQESGFKRLHNHPSLTVENLVLSGDWDDFFDEHDRRAAQRKLDQIPK